MPHPVNFLVKNNTRVDHKGSFSEQGSSKISVGAIPESLVSFGAHYFATSNKILQTQVQNFEQESINV